MRVRSTVRPPHSRRVARTVRSTRIRTDRWSTSRSRASPIPTRCTGPRPATRRWRIATFFLVTCKSLFLRQHVLESFQENDTRPRARRVPLVVTIVTLFLPYLKGSKEGARSSKNRNSSSMQYHVGSYSNHRSPPLSSNLLLVP